jgi:hypothetical protein
MECASQILLFGFLTAPSHFCVHSRPSFPASVARASAHDSWAFCRIRAALLPACDIEIVLPVIVFMWLYDFARHVSFVAHVSAAKKTTVLVTNKKLISATFFEGEII